MEEIPLEIFERLQERLRSGESILDLIVVSTEPNKIDTLQDCIGALEKRGAKEGDLRRELGTVIRDIVITGYDKPYQVGQNYHKYIIDAAVDGLRAHKRQEKTKGALGIDFVK